VILIIFILVPESLPGWLWGLPIQWAMGCSFYRVKWAGLEADHFVWCLI